MVEVALCCSGLTRGWLLKQSQANLEPNPSIPRATHATLSPWLAQGWFGYGLGLARDLNSCFSVQIRRCVSSICFSRQPLNFYFDMNRGIESHIISVDINCLQRRFCARAWYGHRWSISDFVQTSSRRKHTSPLMGLLMRGICSDWYVLMINKSGKAKSEWTKSIVK